MPADADSTAKRLLAEAASRAEHQVAMVRVALGCLMLLFVGTVALVAPDEDRGLDDQLIAATATAVLVTLVGLAALAALRHDRPTGRIAFITSTADVLIVLANIGYSIVGGYAPGAFFALFPAVWLIPVTMAAAALRYSPGLQIYVSGLFVAGLSMLAMVGGFVPIETRREALPDYAFGFGVPPNVVRIIMIASAAFVLVLVARRGRRLLEEAVHETTSRLSLTRFVPRELAPLLAEPGMAGLSTGRRQTVAIVFVDMRGSTARAERTDPERFAVFMSSFRRRVMSAARMHGGMVDKFIGDGALIVFGVPDPAPDDAARAFACADTLVDLIARWNEKHDVQPPVAVGIGVQVGEVFCGVVGDPDRLEFTVLGDPVNVAARLEKATKEHGTPILATAEAVAAAGVDWREVGVETLPGRSEPVRLMAPSRAGAA
ncbi:MAG: adenylate/guanylate cyclase domain-containing protein [Mesorhizobium sp.]